ncbi:MAG: bacterio-opsin activator domain-containing protein [Haloglomus sp.]
MSEPGGVFERTADALVAYDPETRRIVSVNRACGELLGYDPSELRGADLSLLAPDDQEPPPSDEYVQTARATGSVRFDWRIAPRDGPPVTADVHLTVTQHDGAEVALASLRRDDESDGGGRGDESDGRDDESDGPGHDSGRQGSDSTYDRCRALYEHGQLFVWEFDLSAVKRYVDRLDVPPEDVHAHLDANPAAHERLLERLTVLDVNERAVEFYEADSKQELKANLQRVMTDESREQLKQLWQALALDEPNCTLECTAQTLTRERRDVVYEMTVPESHTETYARVYLSGIDISERKHHERELEVVHEARRTLQEALADSTSCEAFADAVCSELITLDGITAARVGTVTPRGTTDSFAAAGSPDERSAFAALTPSECPPETVAVRRDDLVRLPRADEGPTDTATGARDFDATELIALPVAHDGVTRGGLVVGRASDPLLGAHRLRDLLAQTADVLGYALSSATRRQALAADGQVELAFAFEGESVALSRAARAADVTGHLHGAIPRADDTTLCYVTVDRGDVDQLVAAVRETDGIDCVERLDHAADRVQVVTSDPVPNTIVAEHGGNVTEVEVSPSGITLTARFPGDTAFDPVLAELRSRFGLVTMDYRSESPSGTAQDAPLTALTDRQREVLEATFHAGYFEWPRGQNASEIAERLGVSRQAYQQVLRAAERNLLATLFECV